MHNEHTKPVTLSLICGNSNKEVSRIQVRPQEVKKAIRLAQESKAPVRIAQIVAGGVSIILWPK